MSTHYQDDKVVLHHGDCLDVLATLPDASVDAVVTDPPYGLANTDPAHVIETLQRWIGGERDYLPETRGFMGKEWDAFVPPVAVWDECLRVLKPGGHVLAFAGSRTVDLMTLGLRLAGFDIRDSLAWLYGSGFPKSLDVSKAIDKLDATDERTRRARAFQSWLRQHLTPQDVNRLTGTDMGHHLTTHPTQPAVATAELFDLLRSELPKVPQHIEDLVSERTVESQNFAARLVTGKHSAGTHRGVSGFTVAGEGKERRDFAHTPEAREWEGWGTALKPSHEPVVVARKPAGTTAILDTIGSQLGALEEACRRHVSGAARSSAPTPAESSAARTATAPESAATQHEAGQESTTATGAAGGSSAATDTSASAWTAETFSSTVTSWRKCWAEIYEATSMSTTSTGTSRTTDLQTLSSCLSSITQSVTAQSTLDPHSWSSLATAADNLFAAGVLNSRSTLALSVIESATSATQQDSPPAVGSGAAFEPIVMARKPLTGTVAANVLEHGTGALNIDACRIAGDVPSVPQPRYGVRDGITGFGSGEGRNGEMSSAPGGRWPANVVLDESQSAVLDENGGASRFFYVAKAPKSERPVVDGVAHPTVKPLSLASWLVRLVTPPGGTVLEPFAGSGTTVEAAMREGFNVVAVEREADYLPLIMARIDRENARQAAEATTHVPTLFDEEMGSEHA